MLFIYLYHTGYLSASVSEYLFSYPSEKNVALGVPSSFPLRERESEQPIQF